MDITDTESEISQDSSERSDKIVDDTNGEETVKELTFFEKMRLEDEKHKKEQEDYIKYQRENDYPNGFPISLEKQTGLIRTPHIEESQPISLEKQTGLFRTPHLENVPQPPVSLDKSSDFSKTPYLPPQQIPIDSTPSPVYYNTKTFKTTSQPKKKISFKMCKVKSSTASLIILIKRSSKASVYGIISIILFFTIICISLPLVPILVVVLKFKCDNCTYSGDDDYDYDYDYDYSY
ncbi:hypothetical protein ACTA71_004840 [Dictyostelium dimigraforme]